MTTREWIYRCTQYHLGKCCGKGWHRQTIHHATGIPWSEQYCPWYPSKRAAREAGA